MTGESSATGASAAFSVSPKTCASDPISDPSISTLAPSPPITKERMKIQTIEKKNILEIWCLIIASFYSGYVAFYFLKMLKISYEFQERSEGADEILIWIPQTSVAIGSSIFFICVFHQFILKIYNKSND